MCRGMPHSISQFTRRRFLLFHRREFCENKVVKIPPNLKKGETLCGFSGFDTGVILTARLGDNLSH